MRPIFSAISLTLVSALALTACAKRTPSDPAVAAAVKRYDQVKSGMSIQEAIGLLGEPAARQEGAYRWQTAGQPPNNASIEVKFNREGRITAISRSLAQN